MSEKPLPTESVRRATERSIRDDLLHAAIGVTCRMAIPVFSLFLIGLLIDAYLAQMAFYAIIGAVVGFVVAGWLIYRLVKGYQKPKTPETKETR